MGCFDIHLIYEKGNNIRNHYLFWKGNTMKQQITKRLGRPMGLFLLFCILLSSFCLDNTRADSFVYPFFAKGEVEAELVAGNSISNEEVCTQEMLDGNQGNRLIAPNRVRTLSVNRKAENLSNHHLGGAGLSRVPHFYSVEYSTPYFNEADTAEVILYIHQKDGKKRI